MIEIISRTGAIVKYLSKIKMKKNSLPPALEDFNSIWNPFLSAFLTEVIEGDGESHSTRPNCTVGLNKTKASSMIDPALLKKFDARETTLQKGDVLFREGDEALNYFQVLSGTIKLITGSPEGQEFIQGIFRENESFGEPPLFCSFPYPSSAYAIEPSVVLKLSKEKFFRLLSENFDIHIQLDKVLCERLRYKSMILSEISFYDPEHRIMSLLKYLKGMHEPGGERGGMVRGDHKYVVPFTRQQLADMSGLRVETVIRTVKKMEEAGKLQLVNSKITL